VRVTVKNITAVLVLFVMLMPALFMAFSAYRRSSIQHEMKERLEKEQLVSISINENELVWVKLEKEIFYNGNMFDVKAYEIKNGKVHLKGLFDEQEKELNDVVNRQMKNSSTPNYHLLIQFLQLLQNNFLNEVALPTAFYTSHQLKYIQYADRIKENNLSIIIPPPKC
jgi:hypothetical protein